MDSFTEDYPDEMSRTNVYIRSLDTNTTDQTLREMCSKYGEIVSAKAIIDTNTQLCKGYGFVMFLRQDDAEQALRVLRDQGVQVSMARESFSTKLKNLEDPASTNIYMQNLPKSYDEKQLEELLKPYGKVISSRILRDNAGNSRGVGFTRMESRAAAEIVIRSDLNGRILPNTTAPLQMRFADTPHQKKLKEQMVYTRRAPSSPYYGFDPAFGYMPSSPYYLNNYYGVQPYGNMIYAEYMPSSPYSPIYYAPSSPTYVYDYSPTGGSPVFTATDRFNTRQLE